MAGAALVALTGTAAAQETVVAGTDGVGVPKRRKLVRPVYPPEAAAQGLRGIVILELIIGVDGTIDEVNVMRSVPPFDAAAVAAARDWEYEPTSIDGQPVRVKLTVPISFLLKLPQITREEGIPELRQGAIPRVPPEATREAKVTAEITLMPNGEVAEALIIEGDSPWSESMILALRTWRFDISQIGGDIVSFQAEARFIPESRGRASRVPIKLSDVQRRAAPEPEAPAAEPASDTAPDPADEASASRTEPPVATQPEASAPADSPVGTAAPPLAPQPAAIPEKPTADPEAPVLEPQQPREPEPTTEATPVPEAAPVPDVPAPATPAESSEPEAAAAPAPPRPSAAEDTAADASSTPTEPASEIQTTPVESGPRKALEQPVTEVMTLAPSATPTLPARSSEPGVSSVQGVFLGAGLPDMTSGRRPVVPPFARMDGAVGDVTVDFAITPAGTTVVRSVEGPEIFQAAAREAVESWFFARETADRLFATAEFSYQAEGASVQVEFDTSPQ